ncbi:general substrate transporter [Phaeosphaeria sp. MPI-PUGE-AT-0046c]|nr:general substrate transporter [Phaeosphaeria sp. MPI-PUGE-AT-0046c]
MPSPSFPLSIILLTTYLGAISNGYISSLVSSLLSNPLFLSPSSPITTSSPNTTHIGLVLSAHSLGSILAFFPAPLLSERFGRRAAIFSGNVLILCALVGQLLGRSLAQFTAMRVLVGCGAMISTVSSAALIMESVGPRRRAVAGALFNTCWFLGASVAAWACYVCMRKTQGVWSWKGPVAGQMIWAIAQVALIAWCPESPRWLLRKGQVEKAREALVRVRGGEGDDVRREFEDMIQEAEGERSRHGIGEVNEWKMLYATPGNRKRLLLSVVIGVSTQWVGNGIVSFYLSPVLQTIGISSPSTQQTINGSLQIYNWLLASMAALFSERAGRRRLFLASTSTMLIFMVLVTICSAIYSSTHSSTAGYSVIVFLFLFLGGYVIGLTPIPILYINEIWSGQLRTKGATVFWVSQAVAVCFNQFVNPVALGRIAWRYYLVYVGVLVGLGLFVWFCVPETKGLTLDGIRAVFDGERDGNVELVSQEVRREDDVEEVRA